MLNFIYWSFHLISTDFFLNSQPDHRIVLVNVYLLKASVQLQILKNNKMTVNNSANQSTVKYT